MIPCCGFQYDSASLNLTELDRGMSALQAAFEESQQEKAALSAELERAKGARRDESRDAERALSVQVRCCGTDLLLIDDNRLLFFKILKLFHGEIRCSRNLHLKRSASVL